ncbi:hypothetical protein [Ferruginibacter sp.]|nr:hypothetical protein [Ferruginibacter sp.]
MNNLPAFVIIIFILSSILTVVFFYKAANNSLIIISVILGWAILQTVLAVNLFYTQTASMPPRILLMLVPPVILIAVLFITAKGKRFVDGFDIKYLTLLHLVRIPVELVLYWLFIYNMVPQLMTFEGRNFDILAGITAPVVFYFVFVKKQLSKKILLGWNIICLGLLINIVTNAALSAPSIVQQFAFEQPNVAILYFPFNLLPAVVVPLVLLSHLAAIRQLLRSGL